MLICKSVSAWDHDLSTNAEQRLKGALGGRAAFVSSNLASERCALQTTERKRTAYEYQEGSVWYNWYDASFTK